MDKKITDKSRSPQTISCCFIVKNDEKALSRTLENIKGVFDEVVLLDTGSTDRTVEIAKKYDCKVFYYTWEDHFGKALNQAISHATSEWVFTNPADEILSEELKQNIRKLTQINRDVVYAFPRKDEILSCAGGYVEKMFRKGTAKYTEGAENAIHETLSYDCGRVKVDYPIIHQQRENHWLVNPPRILPRIAMDAERTPKEKSTLFYLTKAIGSAFYRFFKLLVIKQGFRDGVLGWKYAAMRWLYQFIKYVFVALKPEDEEFWKKWINNRRTK